MKGPFDLSTLETARVISVEWKDLGPFPGLNLTSGQSPFDAIKKIIGEDRDLCLNPTEEFWEYQVKSLIESHQLIQERAEFGYSLRTSLGDSEVVVIKTRIPKDDYDRLQEFLVKKGLEQELPFKKNDSIS